MTTTRIGGGPQARIGTLVADSLRDTVRFLPALAPALLGFVATAALAVMFSLIPGAFGGGLCALILLLGGSYFTLQAYGLALGAKQGGGDGGDGRDGDGGSPLTLGALHTQIMAVWAGYVGWWLLFASVLAILSFGLHIADANLVWLVQWLVPAGPAQGLALLLILLALRGVFFWFFETSNAFLGVAKMTGGRDILFARSFIYGQRVPMFCALLIAALPLIAAGTFYGVLDLFTINGLGLDFVISLPLPTALFLGLILGYSFILSLFIRTNAYLSALNG